MIIGSGLIAKAFETYRNNDKYIIFASGVSDSTNINKELFEKEKKLLTDVIENNLKSRLVYFSTCSIYDEQMKNNLYVLHKIEMEEIIKNEKNNFIIFRVSNPIGITKNKKTFFNYFIDKIIKEEHFYLWGNSYRNIIDIEDMFSACNYFIDNERFINSIIDIVNPQNYTTKNIVNTIEKHFNKKGKYTILNKGSNPVLNAEISNTAFSKLNIKFEDDYLENILKKYFPLK